MGAVASTLTFTAGQFKYIDVFGIEHTVTTSQTISLSIDDNSTTDVQYSFKTSLTMTLTDGRILRARPSTAGAVGAGASSNENRTVGKLTDAGQGTAFYGPNLGEFNFECPESGTLQVWKVAQITPSDTDFGSAGTITMILEDQYGHRMSIPFQLSGTVSVGQAA